MPARASIYENGLWGVETAPGAGASTYYRLPNTDLTIDRVPNRRVFRAAGHKFTTSVSSGKEHSTGSISGDQGLNDMLFLLRSFLSKGTVVTPTNNGYFTLTPPTGGTGNVYRLVYGGQTTANIANAAGAAAIQAALAALSTVGQASLVEVTGTGPFVIRLRGPLSTGGSITLDSDASGGAAGSVSSPAAGGAKRWIIGTNDVGADDVQTLELRKGQLGHATRGQRAKGGYVAGLSQKWNAGEASFTGDVWAGRLDDPFDMSSTPTAIELPIVPVHMGNLCGYLGTALSGAGMPIKLNRLIDVELGNTDKWSPFMTLDCDVKGPTDGVEHAVGNDIKLSMEHDAASQALIPYMQVGQLVYFVFEGILQDINASYPHRYKWTAGFEITDSKTGDLDGVYGGIYTGTLKSTAALGTALKYEIDTTIAAF